jgi:hypothetical protein
MKITASGYVGTQRACHEVGKRPPSDRTPLTESKKAASSKQAAAAETPVTMGARLPRANRTCRSRLGPPC